MRNILKKKFKSQLETYTPDNIISSYIEIPKGVDPTEAIWHESAIALDTEQICFIYSADEEGLFFIASPAVSLLGKNNYSTPLAAALPNNEDHQGDGAYITTIGNNLYAIAVKDNKTLRSFVGDKVSVLQFAEDKTQFWVDKPSIAWKSLTQYIADNTTKLMTGISLGFFALVLSLLLGTIILKHKTQSYIAQMQESKNKVIEVQEQNVLMMHAQTKNAPINQFLKKYLELSSVVIEQKGRLTSFQYNANQISYTVELPVTTTDLSYYGKNAVPVVKDDMMVIEKEETL